MDFNIFCNALTNITDNAQRFYFIISTIKLGKLWEFTRRYSRKGGNIPLQAAAQILSDKVKDINDYLDWVVQFNRGDVLEEAFYERDHPNQIHQDSLPARTIDLIHFLLHILHKNNFSLYGIRPSSSCIEKIPFKVVKYFNNNYDSLYSERDRNIKNLIFKNITVKKEQVLSSIQNTNFQELVKEISFNN
jgi:hypothetical protein